MWLHSCFLSVYIFLLLLSAVSLYYNLTFNPKFDIQELYIIPSLNNPNSYNATNLNRASILIDLKITRLVTDPPLFYQDLNITLYYSSNRSSGPVGHAVVPGFSHGPKKTVHRIAVVDAFEKISGGSTVALTVELATTYTRKWRVVDGDNKLSTAVAVAADLKVDASGVKVSENPIRLL